MKRRRLYYNMACRLEGCSSGEVFDLFEDGGDAAAEQEVGFGGKAGQEDGDGGLGGGTEFAQRLHGGVTRGQIIAFGEVGQERHGQFWPAVNVAEEDDGGLAGV